MKQWIGLLGLALVLHAAPARAEVRTPKLEVTIVAPQDAKTVKWAEDAKKLTQKWYPKIVEILGVEQPVDPLRIKLVFRKMEGVAYSSGREIHVSTDWIEQHPDDIGLVVHELTHQVQSYPDYDPSWVTEGIADYVRWWCYEPKSPRSPINFSRAKYSDSYRTTAAFFHWIEVKNPGFIKTLSDVMLKNTYGDDRWSQWANAPIDDLWAQFKADSQKPVKK